MHAYPGSPQQRLRRSRACRARSCSSPPRRRRRSRVSPRRRAPAVVAPERLAAALLPVDGPLELRLVHLRAAFDVQLARLVVELLLRAPLRSVRSRSHSAAPARRNVLRRRPRSRPGLACTRALLVHSAGSDLLRRARRLALLASALLDVLVLARALRSLLDSTWWHGHLLSVAVPHSPQNATKTSVRRAQPLSGRGRP